MVAVFWPRRAEWYPAAGRGGAAVVVDLAGVPRRVDWRCSWSTTCWRPPGEAFYGLGAYPPMAVLASLAFMMLGSSYWGYCYLIGGLFLVLAVAMTLWLPAAPLAFGLCWAASLVLLGMRLGRLAGRE